MAIPCHPAPQSAASASAPPSDPYESLGLDHDATPSQIKMAYRKLALRYHPDRVRVASSSVGCGNGGRQGSGQATAENTKVVSSQQDHREVASNTDKFTEISAAYAVISDPARKKEYDHLYKYGAFDNDVVDKVVGRNDRPQKSYSRRSGTTTTAANTATNNYRYTENYSGGYYKPGYKPPTSRTTSQQRPSFAQQAQRAAAAAAAFQSMQSQDSFFDDLIYSPKSSPNKDRFDFATNDHNDNNQNNTTANKASTTEENNNNASSSSQQQQQQQQQQQSQYHTKPGIGFSFAPAGRHLSVHVPSRNEIMTNVARGDMPRGDHLFGTRVTISQQQTEGLSKLDRLATSCGGGGIVDATLGSCSGISRGGGKGGKEGGGGGVSSGKNNLKEKKVVSTTMRIAKGQKRIVRRTAHLRPDGTKEVVIEENGVVRRRYVDESARTNSNGSPNANASEDGQQHRDDDETKSSKEKEQGQGEEDEEGLQKERGFTLMGLFKSCLAPCAAINDG